MTVVCVVAPIDSCGGKAYAVGDVADLNAQHAQFFEEKGIVKKAVIWDQVTCAGLICGRLCNPAWQVKVELDVGNTGTVDYTTLLAPRPDGGFGGDIREIPATPDEGEEPDPEATAPLETKGETRLITLSVDVGAPIGVIAKQVECVVGGENDPCSMVDRHGSC